jgi:hypothetical protein
MPDQVNPGAILTGTPEDHARAAEVAARVAAASQPSVPAPTPVEPATGGLRDVKGLIFGKYKTEADAQQGFGELLATLGERNRQLAEMQARISQVEGVMARVNPPPEQKNPYQELAEQGIDPSPIDRLLTAKLQEFVGPLVAGARADEQVAATYPEFPQAKPMVRKFLNDRPELSQRYDVMWRQDPVGANEWAFLRWQREAGAPPAGPPAPPEPGKGDAALPGTSGSARSVPDDRQERLNNALEYYQRFGNESPLVHERLRGIVTDEHLAGG